LCVLSTRRRACQYPFGATPVPGAPIRCKQDPRRKNRRGRSRTHVVTSRGVGCFNRVENAPKNPSDSKGNPLFFQGDVF